MPHSDSSSQLLLSQLPEGHPGKCSKALQQSEFITTIKNNTSSSFCFHFLSCVTQGVKTRSVTQPWSVIHRRVNRLLDSSLRVQKQPKICSDRKRLSLFCLTFGVNSLTFSSQLLKTKTRHLKKIKHGNLYYLSTKRAGSWLRAAHALKQDRKLELSHVFCYK